LSLAVDLCLKGQGCGQLLLLEAIEKHAEYTRTQKAISVLANWDEIVQKFLTVMPRDYKRVLPAIQNALASGLSGDNARLQLLQDRVELKSNVR
jgi:hypothetical protein